jgi:threonine dehydratase
MMKRLMFVAGVGAGYVLGTKAGQRRYEQIKARADQVWSSEPVQEKVQAAVTTLQEKAPVVAEKVGAAARAAGAQVKDQVKDRMQGEDLPETIHRGRDGTLHSDDRGFGPGADKLP